MIIQNEDLRRQRRVLFWMYVLAFLLVCVPAVYADAIKASVKVYKNWRQEGIASWYGDWHAGRLTANGERFDPRALTAAHKTLPLGSYVIVKNLRNGRMLEVRINDRGPYLDGRVIDLSEAAAKRLGMHKEGLAPVLLVMRQMSETKSPPKIDI